MLEGGCTCGTVRYRMTSQPFYSHCCHCRWCQRESGSAFALNAMIEADRLEVLSGHPDSVVIPSESGNGQKVTRCPTCLTALWSNYAGADDAIHFVKVGTLDDPDRVPPNIHIYTASKQPWLVLPQDVLAFSDYYVREDIWPQKSLDRRAAAIAAHGST